MLMQLIQIVFYALALGAASAAVLWAGPQLYFAAAPRVSHWLEYIEHWLERPDEPPHDPPGSTSAWPRIRGTA